MKYEYRREDTLTNKLHNRDQQLAEARNEIRELRNRVEQLTKDRQRLYSRVWGLKQTRATYAPRPQQPRDEGEARLLAAVQEAYGRRAA
jgi:chromosome segregation ATPase